MQLLSVSWPGEVQGRELSHLQHVGGHGEPLLRMRVVGLDAGAGGAVACILLFWKGPEAAASASHTVALGLTLYKFYSVLALVFGSL